MRSEDIQIFEKDLDEDLRKHFFRKIISEGYERVKNPFFEKRKDEFNTDLITIISFDEPKESDEIATEIRRAYKRPVCIRRFLALSQQRKKFPKNSSIVTFALFWTKGGDIFVPCFWEDCDSLPDLWSVKELWTSKCWFAID